MSATACAYCGLPASGPEGTEEPVFCCFGCRFAASVSAASGEEGQARGTLLRLGLSIFFSMNVLAFTMALWSYDVYDGAAFASESAASLADLFRWLGLLFAAPVLVLLGVPLATHAVERLRDGELSTDLLLVLGVAASYGYSVVAVFTGGTHVYFEVGCAVLVAVTLGRWLEATGKLKTTQTLRSLERLLPTTARVLATEDAPETTVPLANVTIGQLVRVLPGERIPVDGRLHSGPAAIDEQLVTGESQPAIKESGDRVLAGTLNLDGDLRIEVTAAPREGALQRLIDAVCEAATARGRLQRTADRIAEWFIPLVLVLAVATFAGHAVRSGWIAGVMAGLAVVLIACPCALGVATPLAIWAALGRAFRHGVVFRDGDTIQRLADIRAIGFDKTGTLTTGEPTVERFVADTETARDEILHSAFVASSASTHGLSRAIREFALESRTDTPGCPTTTQLTTLPGRGLTLTTEWGRVSLGNERLMAECALAFPPALRAALDEAWQGGQSYACLGWGGRVRGVFVFREEIRAAARPTLDALAGRGLHVTMLTGDHAMRGERLAESLGVSVLAELLPEEKREAVRELRAEHGAVAMVGDGVNDAPALAEADVGVALGCGADVSRDAADVCLLGDDLARIPWAIDLARQTIRTVRQNLFWAFAYNVVGIAFAATGWLNPIWAAVAMVGSSLFVVTNSLRLANASEEDAESSSTAQPQAPASAS